MIKALSFAAALALLPLSASVAQDARGASEAALEEAAATFEARMESFGERAETISDDKSLSEEQRELRIAALWTEYQPDVNAFTALATQHATGIAAEALAGIDIEAVVAEALAGVEASGALTGALAGVQGMAANGSWASNDPEHMATYGLMADYTIGEALDEVEAEVEAGVDVAAITTEALAEVEASGALTGALAGVQGMVANGSWASNDPEHMATYGLMADYAIGEALDEVDAGLEEIEVDTAVAVEVDVADEG